ncbi:hypothetical protein [Paraburkholderia phenazinium]|uniref:hypothetical protein n=1 Tax=Paraburkholderia phenazinium TaxID=60549 RepID=UPI0015898F4A|nr:hypothetical protein [Paraburkholderia phenazinium]
MSLNRRMLYIPIFHIDANLINARQKLAEVNQLERWAEDDVILINMSSTALAEARADRNASRVAKAAKQIFTTTPTATEVDPLFKQVEAALFPGGTKDDNQRNDVKIVCDAAKYQAILVTGDGASKTQPGGILGNRDKLRGIVEIFSPAEAVAFVRAKIRERDEFNERYVTEVGGVLPPWTGKD